jgi:hypothetical protein
MAYLKVNCTEDLSFSSKSKFVFRLKEFDQLQEKKTEVNEQFRTIVGQQQTGGMSIMNTNTNYQGGRQQR